jgi:type I restriction enzyme, S subunit
MSGPIRWMLSLNRETDNMNETLEAMARTLFQSRFVDFDPVRARAEGRATAGMDAETAAMFADGFEETQQASCVLRV